MTNEIVLQNFEVLRRLYSDQLKTKEVKCGSWSWFYTINPSYNPARSAKTADSRLVAPAPATMSVNGGGSGHHSVESLVACNGGTDCSIHHIQSSSSAQHGSFASSCLRLTVHFNEETPLPQRHLLVFKATIVGEKRVPKVSSKCISFKSDGWQSLGENSIDLCLSKDVGQYLVNSDLRVLIVVRHDWLVCTTEYTPLRAFCNATEAAKPCDRKQQLSAQPARRHKLMESLETAMMRLLDGGLLSDIELKTTHRSFKAHKCILAARSKYFLSKLATDITEAAPIRQLTLSDIDGDDLEILLKFMYTNEITLSDRLAAHMLELADRFQMNELKLRCSTYMGTMLKNSEECGNPGDVLLIERNENQGDMSRTSADVMGETAGGRCCYRDADNCEPPRKINKSGTQSASNCEIGIGNNDSAIG